MRKEFAEFLYNEMASNEKIHLITGDLGYGLWDKIKLDYPDRFHNVIDILNNITTYKPNKLSTKTLEDFLYNNKPSYLNLKR